MAGMVRTRLHLEGDATSIERRSYRVLAERLRAEILSGAISDGALLPNERDLGGQTGLGRSSVREALRMLEMEGFVLTRKGRNGGSFVQLPGMASVGRTLATFVRGQGIRFDAVLEAREALEPALAGLAALHRVDSDLDALIAATGTMQHASDDAAFVAANSEWHWAVAQASRNPVLISVTAAIGDLLHQSNVVRLISADVRTAVIRAHAGIQAAIRSRDASAAQRRMARHLRSYREQVAPVAPANIDLEA